MATTTRIQRSYDHRLRELVRSTGDIQHAIHRGVPRSTAHGWLKSPQTEVVSVDVTDMNVLRLQQELLTLRKRVARLIALLRLRFRSPLTLERKACRKGRLQPEL